jgi:hypothetical protein
MPRELWLVVGFYVFVFHIIEDSSLFFPIIKSGLHENEMSTDMENGRGNKRASVTRGSRNSNHGKKEALHCAQT